MNIRDQVQQLIEQLSEEQLAILLPLITSVRDSDAYSSEASQAYQAWVGPENDIYDELFAGEDELATR